MQNHPIKQICAGLFRPKLTKNEFLGMLGELGGLGGLGGLRELGGLGKQGGLEELGEQGRQGELGVLGGISAFKDLWAAQPQCRRRNSCNLWLANHSVAFLCGAVTKNA